MHDRAYVWYVETLDGCLPLLDENQSAFQYGNKLTYPSLQHETSDQYHGKCRIDEGDVYIGSVPYFVPKLTNKVRSKQLLLVRRNKITIH